MRAPASAADSRHFNAFRALEEDFIDNKIAINNRTHIILQNKDSNAQENQAIQAQLMEAQRCLKMMSVELRNKAPDARRLMQNKLNVYQSEMEGLIRDFERAKVMAKESKSHPNSMMNKEAVQSRLQRGTDTLHRSSRQLDQSLRIVAETEQIGVSVLDTLSQQRESLISTHHKVHEVSDVTRQTRHILKRMTRRILTNNIVLWSMIALLSISICLVIYNDFVKRTREEFW